MEGAPIARRRLSLIDKCRFVESYIAAQVDADIERVALDTEWISFSMKSFCRQNKLDRKCLYDWLSQYKAGMYSRQFFEDDEEYEKYMERKEVTRSREFFLGIINQKLAEKVFA